MGRVHLVGETQTGLGPSLRRRGLRDLAIAVAAGAIIWGVDASTGGHLAAAVNVFAVRLSSWYEERREPVVTCEPGEPRAYTSISGIVLHVPRCWEVETTSLLGLEVHRFHDPEARAGTLSVSVEPIASGEDRTALSGEFARMAALPGARVDGVRSARGLAGPDAPDAQHRKPSVPDSHAERILHGEEGPGAPPHAEADPTETSAAPSRAFRIVEAGGLLGSPPQEGRSALQPDGSYAKRTWTWLLLGERAAVRVVYAVRADWSENTVVGKEFKRADAVARSVTLAP